MLVTSKLNNKTWLWVNIPKTATTSTMKAIFPDREYNLQHHSTYRDLIRQYQDKYSVFTMVRNPLDRFLSGLNHIFSVCECGNCKIDLTDPPKTEEVISFLADMLKLKSQHENFFDTVYKNNTNSLYLDVVRSLQRNFQRNIIIENTKYCVRWSFIIPQSYILDGLIYGRIFRFEEINNFTNFVQRELGYIMPQIKYREYSNKIINVDKSNTTLKQLLYEFHQDDFINYNYEI